MLDFLFTKTPLVYLVQSFWRDEAFTVLLARQPIGQILELTAKDFNPPLYYLLIHFWVNVFGSSEIAVRSFSLLCYAVMIIIIFHFFEKVFKFPEKKSLLYTLFFLFNPLALYFAFEARMYAMLAFFATASWYFLKIDKRRFYVLSTVLGLYTHYFMIFVVISQLIYVASSHLLKKGLKHVNYKEIGLSVLFFIPWIPFMITASQLGQDNFWILKPQFETYTHASALLYSGYELGFGFFKNELWGFTILFNLIPLYGLFTLKKKNRSYQDLFLLLSSWFFIPLVITFGISFFKPIFLPRYLIASSVGFTLFIILIIDEFHKKLRIPLIIALVLFSSLYISNHIGKRVKMPSRQVFSEIRTLAKKGDLIYVTSELDFFTAQYYYGIENVFIYAKDYEEIPHYTGKVMIPKEKVVHTLPYFPKKAFVINEDLTYSIQALY